jgi:CDP-diacylglycerol--glycerol-3-phosphate 3-phosphatidyltransferase
MAIPRFKYTIFGTIPNQITCVRLFLIPVLWICAILNLPSIIGIGLVITFISDFLDGFLARLLNQATETGNKLDSLADHILLPSIFVWLFLFEKDIYLDNKLLLIIVSCCYISSLVIGLIKSRRYGSGHVLSGKIMGLIGYVFLITTFFNCYNEILFYVTVYSLLLFSVETIVYHLKKDLFSNNLKSVILGLFNFDIKLKFIRYII